VSSISVESFFDDFFETPSSVEFFEFFETPSSAEIFEFTDIDARRLEWLVVLSASLVSEETELVRTEYSKLLSEEDFKVLDMEAPADDSDDGNGVPSSLLFKATNHFSDIPYAIKLKVPSELTMNKK